VVARPLDLARCESLAADAADGDADAWKALVTALWPTLRELARSNRSLATLGGAGDAVEDVVARVVGRLGRGDGHGLRMYDAWHERHPDRTFEDWIRIVTANAVRDHLRDKLGDSRTEPQPEGVPSVKRLINEFAVSTGLENIGVRPPLTAAQTARELLEYAHAALPDEQFGALRLWLEGAEFDEIEEHLGLTNPGAGKKLVRAAVAVLRRRFGAR
jgi:DNA-directed RNA polymerase specialized sigma24 family protein